jgi:hypothetical protein
MVAALLQIIAADSVDLYVSNAFLYRALDRGLWPANPLHISATRQACAVYLKNRVSISYFVADPARQRPDQTAIVQSDRDALKSSILRLLSVSPSRSITGQLSTTLKTLVAHDFPDSWPTLLNEVKALLTSNDIHEVGAGCVATLEVVRAFRYVSTSKARFPFPHLNSLLQIPPKERHDASNR